MELSMIVVSGYLLSMGNFLLIWVFLSFGLLSMKGMSMLLMFLVGFGGLILVGFLMVAPNGIETSFVASIIMIFPLPIFGTWNCLMMFLSLVMLAYIL